MSFRKWQKRGGFWGFELIKTLSSNFTCYKSDIKNWEHLRRDVPWWSDFINVMNNQDNTYGSEPVNVKANSITGYWIVGMGKGTVCPAHNKLTEGQMRLNPSFASLLIISGRDPLTDILKAAGKSSLTLTALKTLSLVKCFSFPENDMRREFWSWKHHFGGQCLGDLMTRISFHES